MRACTWERVRKDLAVLCGMDPTALQAVDVVRLDRLLSARAQGAWTVFRWPELCPVEQRHWLEAWNAAETYAAGDVVWYEGEEGYFEALEATSVGESPETAPAKWEEATDAELWMSLEQSGETVMGEVLGVFYDDPRASRRAKRVEWQLSERGVEACGAAAPKEPWVLFRRRAPEWEGEEWDAAETYAAGEQVWWGSDFYACATATSAGESPGTEAAKWSKLEFPEVLRVVVVAGAYADWMRTEGADAEVVGMEEGKAEGALYRAMDRAVYQSGQGYEYLFHN